MRENPNHGGFSPCSFPQPSALSPLPSLVKPLLLQPSLDHTRDLIAVAVHHHHVRVAADADLRQIDHVIAPACAPHALEKVDSVGSDLGPPRILFYVVAVDREDRDALQSVHLLRVTDSG